MSQQQPKPPPPPSTPQKSSVSTSVVKKELSNSDLGIPDLPSLEFTSIFKSVKKGVKTGVKTAVKAGKSLYFSRFHIKVNPEFSLSFLGFLFLGQDPIFFSGFKPEIHFIFQFQFFVFLRNC